MRNFLPILASAFYCWLSPTFSEAAKKPDCPDNSCFETQIIEQEQHGNCTTYTLEIGHNGDCSYALSHFSIEIGCGQITDLSNSGGWAMEVGTTDPTTGITGIKIDDIKDFGEGNQPESFTVSYTICNTANCSAEELVPSKVAYKAATCVHYQDLPPFYTPMSTSLLPTDVLCAGDANGAIDLEVSGGEAPYTYQWSTGATSEDLENISAGTYTVSITDGTGAVLSETAIVNQPEVLDAQAQLTHISCNGSGSIQAQATGGTAPYSYQWSNGATTASIEGLTAGTYSLTLSDAKGCAFNQSFVIEDHSLQLSISGGGSCESKGLLAGVSGGTSPYTYLWNTGETTAGISPAESGTYTLSVTDAAGCTISGSAEFNSGAALEASISQTAPGCANGSDGSIDLTVSGGSGDYSYEWSNGQTTEDLDGLAAGTYTVTITDANGCSISASATLSNPNAVYIQQIALLQPSCQDSLGSITVDALYGTAPYTYEWSNGASGSSISELEPGTYTVTVTDANGCTATRSFTIQQPPSLQLSISGGNCGNTLSVSVSGGTDPYSYEWNTGDSTATIEYSSGGTYTVTVTDANGCSSTESITVPDPTEPISLSYVATNPLCNGESSGSIDLIVEGGSGDYSYEWSNGATTENLEGLPAGTYSVNVTDSNGCTSTLSVTLTAPNPIFIRLLELVKGNCQGDGGSITVDALYGTAPYTYEWSNGASGATASTLSPGFYTVTVTDANGCTSQRRFYMSEEKGPAVTISSAGCDNAYELSASVTAGTAPYTYLWSNGETSSSINVTTGTYSVTVTDANGCSGTDSISLEESSGPLSATASTSDVSCAGGNDGTASITVSGGVAPYTFDWSSGHSSQSASDLSAGVYSVQLTDANGCSEVLAFTITEPQALSLTAVVENNQACGGEANGSIEVSVSGGTSPYVYEWNTGESSSSLSGLTAGNYTLSVTDSKGCVSIRSFTVEEESTGTAPTATLEDCADTVICRGQEASLPVYFSGDGPYTLEYSVNGSTQSITTSANPYLLTVSPEQATTYSLLSVRNNCGEGEASGQASIQLSDCDKLTICEESCFSTQILSNTTEGNCQTITLQVNSNGDCSYALSHFNVAVGCGSVSNVSNSGNWPMELNAYDPTTGLYGIKIDNIKDFGESDQPESFTLTYTLCSEEASCLEAVSSCGPLVAYKAGQCVTYDKAGTATPDQPGDGWGEVSMLALPDFTMHPNPYEGFQELHISLQNLSTESKASLLISNMSGVKVHQSQHMVGPENTLILLPLSNVPAGIYLVSVQIEGRTLTKQLYVL